MAEQNRCRHCREEMTLVLADLGDVPIANDLAPADDPAGSVASPLKVMVCSSCRLAQTVDVKDAADLFRSDYCYFSSASTGWVDHARRYVDAMVARFDLPPGARHVELASNDGYLLQFSRQHALNALGIEPCASVANAALEKGLPTRIAFFSRAYAAELREQGWQADLITANNVFAHVPDINDFALGIHDLLNPEGVATIEVQHLLRLMQCNQFDTIYHEHFSYYSLLSARRVFEAAGLRLFDVEELPTHGGSLRYFLCRADASHVETPNVARVLAEEQEYGLDGDDAYRRFAENVAGVRQSLRALLTSLKADGQRVAAYGAPAKGTTLLNVCGVDTALVEFTVDKSPSKQGKAIPGVGIPIHAPEMIASRRPDYVLILPWNLKDEIVEEVGGAAGWQPKFITPIPWPAIL
jgi:hypothetical protein